MTKKGVEKGEEKERRVCPSKGKHDARSLEGIWGTFSQSIYFQIIARFLLVKSVDQPRNYAA
jgi:hypothetical protein